MQGGYREGSGRSKSGYYRGIYCGSTYELCWVIYSLDHGIEFTRFPGKLEKDKVVYYPDFLLADGKTIVETKGYEKEEVVNKKTLVAESFGYNVVVLRKNDLKYAFDYVKEKYNTSKFYDLYDGYKPKYEQVCRCCSVVFLTDRLTKSEEKFCGRICAGKYRKQSNNTAEVRSKISTSLTGRIVAPYKRLYKQIWITDGEANTRIKEDSEIPNGFRRGRV
jgi:hypothetical protein